MIPLQSNAWRTILPQDGDPPALWHSCWSAQKFLFLPRSDLGRKSQGKTPLIGENPPRPHALVLMIASPLKMLAPFRTGPVESEAPEPSPTDGDDDRGHFGREMQIVNALNGNPIALVPEIIPSMDEGWYDSGDGRWFAPSGTLEEVGAIDAETNTALLPFPPARTGGRSVAAFSENNHVLVIWPPPSLPPQTVADALNDRCNSMFNLPAKSGCIAVYTH